jgi:hypothetical protein
MYHLTVITKEEAEKIVGSAINPEQIKSDLWTDTKKLYFVIIQVYAGASYEG